MRGAGRLPACGGEYYYAAYDDGEGGLRPGACGGGIIYAARRAGRQPRLSLVPGLWERKDPGSLTRP